MASNRAVVELTWKAVGMCMTSSHKFLMGFSYSFTFAVCLKDIGIKTTWGRILLEKLVVPQLVKNFPKFYVTSTNITVS